MDSTIKLQAFLAHAGIASRRKSEQLIVDGIVTVNGETAHIGQRIDPTKDTVAVNQTKIGQPKEKLYFILNKPRGIVSTTNDELNRKNVIELLPVTQRAGMFPVGRLDQDSEGLIMLTNDGELAYILTHPKYEIEKTYHVLMEGIPSTVALNYLERGVRIGNTFAKPVKTSILRHENNNTWFEIVISEGQKHQVRRMINRMGYEVIRLMRVKMGPFLLGNLPTGKLRELSEAELLAVENIKKTYQSK